MAKLAEIWDKIEIGDFIHIPQINRTFPVFDKEKRAIKLFDKENAIDGFFILTEKFSYDIELIKG